MPSKEKSSRQLTIPESDEDNTSVSVAGGKALAHSPSGSLCTPRRKGGFTELEKNCFKFPPVPSPRAQEKFSVPEGQRSCSQASGADPDHLNSSPNCSPTMRNRLGRIAMDGRGRTADAAAERSPLDAEADRVAQVLGKIYPSTKEVKQEPIPFFRRKHAFEDNSGPQPTLSRETKEMSVKLNSIKLFGGAKGSALATNLPASDKSTRLKQQINIEKGLTTASVGKSKQAGAASGNGSTAADGKLSKSQKSDVIKGFEDAPEVEAVGSIEKTRLKRSLALLRREHKMGPEDGNDHPLSHVLKDVDPTTRPMFENAILMTKFNAGGGIKRDAVGYSLNLAVPKGPPDPYDVDLNGHRVPRTNAFKSIQKVARKMELMNALGDARVNFSGTDETNFSLRGFRRRLLQKWGSVHEAFNNVDVDASQELDPKEWEIAMTSAHVCNMREAHLMFELLDADHDGFVSAFEFRVGIEAIAPIYNLETFRKRLLCLGFRTMMQAVKMMESAEGDGTMRKPLNYHDFAVALRCVYIYDPAETNAIWEAVRDPTDDRCSVSEIAAGLGMVSPSFLLEELRERVLQRNQHGQEIWKSLFQWGGPGLDGTEITPALQRDLDRWWTAKRYKDHAVAERLLNELRERGVDPEGLRPPGTAIAEFVESTVFQLGFSPSQAEKCYRLVDLDQNGELEMGELFSAMNLAMPDVSLEDIRLTIRQRHRSIFAAFAAASEKQYAGSSSLDDAAKFTPDELEIFMEGVDISLKDIKKLFSLIDAAGIGSLSLLEFFKGIRLFAPSCILENIRLQLLAVHRDIPEGFHSDAFHDPNEPIDQKDLHRLFERLGVLVDDAEIGHVFACLDVRNVGSVTISELIASMQSLNPGSCQRTNFNECEKKAERSVKAELSGVRKNVSELKLRVRQGLEEPKSDKVGEVAVKRKGIQPNGARSAAGGELSARQPRDTAELARIQYQARRILGKNVSAPELRPREQRSTDTEGARLQLPKLDKQRNKENGKISSKTGGKFALTTGTFDRINANLMTLKPEQAQRAQLSFEPLTGYFSTASETLEEHCPLFEVRRKRGELHSEITRHVAQARLKIK